MTVGQTSCLSCFRKYRLVVAFLVMVNMDGPGETSQCVHQAACTNASVKDAVPTWRVALLPCNNNIHTSGAECLFGRATAATSGPIGCDFLTTDRRRLSRARI